MGKIILNFIIVVFICFSTFLFIASSEAGAVVDNSTSDGISSVEIHAGTAWDAYNSGNLTKAEQQFLFLIEKSKQEKQSVNNNNAEIFNLQLGLAYTRTKLANAILSKETTSRSESTQALSNSSASKKLLISSKEIFADLIQKQYKLTDCVPAILGILSQLKDYKTMEQYLPMLETLFSGEELNKWDYLFAESAWAAYNEKNYKIAQEKFEALLQKHVSPKNLNGTVTPE
ncbi:MAG: hypothetical protein HQK69_06180, partial [Desulfamplus sp.]|nr:hypothetical protein [Desulfamplus sp.]